MAIHPDYPGLVADVVVNGRALDEHRDDESPDPNTTSVYIEAKAGEYFAVRYTLPSTQFTTYSIKASVRLDGTHVRANVYDRNIYSAGITQLFGTSSAYVGGRNMGQRFRFTALTTYETTGAVDHSLKKQLASAGSISVSFYMVKNIRAKQMVPDNIPQLQGPSKVPEKALKGSSVSHKTTLDPLMPAKSTGWVDVEHVHYYGHGEIKPFAVFNFRYRSSAALKSLHIIPRSPSPVPLEDRPEEDLTPAEMAELLKRYRAKEADARKIKRERAENGGDDDGLTVVEERASKRPRTSNAGREIIVID